MQYLAIRTQFHTPHFLSKPWISTDPQTAPMQQWLDIHLNDLFLPHLLIFNNKCQLAEWKCQPSTSLPINLKIKKIKKEGSE